MNTWWTFGWEEEMSEKHKRKQDPQLAAEDTDSICLGCWIEFHFKWILARELGKISNNFWNGLKHASASFFCFVFIYFSCNKVFYSQCFRKATYLDTSTPQSLFSCLVQWNKVNRLWVFYYIVDTIPPGWLLVFPEISTFLSWLLKSGRSEDYFFQVVPSMRTQQYN